MQKEDSMLIFFDIDGTLIAEGTHTMAESTKEAIRQARKNGHICMINTGRSKKLVVPEISQMAEFDGLLLGCGTMVVYRDKTLLHKTFDGEQAQAIIDGLRRHRVDALLEGSENNYNDSPDRIFSESFAAFLKRFEKRGYGSYAEAVGHFDKLYCYVERPEYMAGFREEFDTLLDFVDREKGFFELTPKGCSKASAMEYTAQLLGMPMGDTAAIGDSNNDVTMLACAGKSIAMGNATQTVKQLADFVTTDVEDDGILNALRWLGVCK